MAMNLFVETKLREQAKKLRQSGKLFFEREELPELLELALEELQARRFTINRIRDLLEEEL